MISKAKKIKLLITDVDGVLTDGGIIYDGNNVESKIFNVKDGLICKFLINSGINLGIITGRNSNIVKQRGNELNFKYIYQDAIDKMEVLNEILKLEQIGLEHVAFIGDDINDLSVIESVGLSATTNDAFKYIKDKVDFISSRDGGQGAFRDFADYILKSKEN